MSDPSPATPDDAPPDDATSGDATPDDSAGGSATDREFADIEAAFSAFIERARVEPSIDVDAFCAEHPALQRLLSDAAPLPSSFWAGVVSRYVPESHPDDARLRPGTPEAAAELAARVAQLRDERGADARYSGHRVVARGGMGAILEVWDRALQRHVAMKVVREHSDDAHLVARFVDEAQITGQLDHPGIPPVHDLGVDADGQLFYTMPLIRGRDLHAILRDGIPERDGWNRTRVVGILQRAADALAHAHSRGVLHRDLKPANIMVGPFNETYVMDWGLAKLLDADANHRANHGAKSGIGAQSQEQQRTGAPAGSGSSPRTVDGSVIGTPSYMPLEQAHGALEDLGPTADVYSMGAILYTLLTGRPPYVGPDETPTASTIVERVRQGAPGAIDEVVSAAGLPPVPPELSAICERAMARTPAARYPSMQDFSDDLRAYLEGRVVQAYRTGAWAELRNWVRRNRTVAALTILLIGATCFGSLGFLWYEQKSSAEIRRLADVRLFDLCQEASERLWPPYPEQLPALRQWQATATALADRTEQHRARLRELGDQPARADGSVEAWEKATLTDLVAKLACFESTSPHENLRLSLTRRIAFAEAVDERTMYSPQAQRLWSAASAAIAAAPVYQGLQLPAQRGLLPLRENAQGLWEFWHVQSGAAPLPSDNAAGGWQLEADTGIVLVLIPGGRALVGSPAHNSTTQDSAAHADGNARPDEFPQHEVRLAPYFLAKYELTQAQWLRITGNNPSSYSPLEHATSAGRTHTLQHPVEQISWTDCHNALARLDLRLPTEAQWEHAARAGTATIWWSGDASAALPGVGNTRDQEWIDAAARGENITHYSQVADGYVATAPVGSYAPNPFGLHDTIGNVWEWCHDWHGAYTLPTAANTGERQVPAADQLRKVQRGGSFYSPSWNTRAAHRSTGNIDARVSRLGVRPARELRK